MKRFLSLILILVLLCGCTAPAPTVTGELTVHFLDVGQADCTLLQCDGETLLIDGGNVEDSDRVVAYLLDQNVTKLDYVVCTHAHEDHVGGLPAVLAVFETANLWCPVTDYDSRCFEDFLYYADQQNLSLTCPDPGSTYALGDAEITVLGPVSEYDETNNTSIVLRVDYGETSFLFTGDAERQVEQDILDAGFDVSATVLKAGHHGSSTSNSYRWLREVSPVYTVIPVGADNAYGHPHEEVLSRLQDADVTVYRTDLQGHIVCRSDGSRVTFSTQKHTAAASPAQRAESELLIGNRNSKKFHLPSCSGLPVEQNRVEFSDYDSAIAAGYTPCGNCIG